MNQSPNECPSSLLMRDTLRIYAKGFAMMVATGVFMFGAFCYYLWVRNRQQWYFDIVPIVGSLCALATIWFLARGDGRVPEVRRARDGMMWIVFFFLCLWLYQPLSLLPHQEPEKSIPLMQFVTGLLMLSFVGLYLFRRRQIVSQLPRQQPPTKIALHETAEREAHTSGRV